MAIYPGATVRLLTAKARSPMAAYNRVNLHVAVSEAASLYGAFNKAGAADSHFYVRKDGSVEQYVDTAKRAYADYEGNDATISIETQGGVTNPQGEPWTAAQAETLAQIYAWTVRTHGIAVQMATSSQPGPTSKGLSWHRLGIDGNFPALPSILAGRKQRGGGLRYSTAAGKICPGDAKIGQIPSIYNRAVAILGAPTTTPQEDDMFTDQDRANLAALTVAMGALGGATTPTPDSALYLIREIRTIVTEVRGVLHAGTEGTPVPATVYQRLARVEAMVTELTKGAK